MKPGVIYLIPTPLSPDTAQSVLSPQVKEIVGQTQHFFCENLRTSRRFLSELKIGVRIDDLHFYLLDKDTSEAEAMPYLQVVLAGEDAAVLSEAGCPGVADPGALAVRLAHRAGIRVVPLAGPSAILLALMGSGFNGQSFVFHGYLPIDRVEKHKVLRQLEDASQKLGQTQIFMETPFRNNQMLAEILTACRPDTRLCIAANLTGSDEFLQTKTLRQWKNELPDLHKKPAVFVLFAR
jgi:16S rRNA (cytidine1402-2'-O)-methyltransferase